MIHEPEDLPAKSVSDLHGHLEESGALYFVLAKTGHYYAFAW